MEEISDGRLYGINDMVQADCQDCVGCSKCCHDMVDTIILSPLDIYNLCKRLGKNIKQLMEREVVLNVVNKLVLPNLKMTETGNCCGFLDSEGRCSVHEARPDLCRLFPLGRVYENGDFKYFLQTGQCDHVRTKIKVGKWIDTPEPVKNKQYILRWHDLLAKAEELLADSEDDEFNRNLNMALLNTFYMNEYDVSRDFYAQFNERAEKIEAILDM
jgi:Fe-S-cluster containining protein